MTTNVPAERLRNRIREDHGEHEDCKFRHDLDEALIRERELTLLRYAPVMADHPLWVEENCCNMVGCGDENYWDHLEGIIAKEPAV